MALAKEAIETRPELTIIQGGRTDNPFARCSIMRDFIQAENERMQAFTPEAPPTHGEVINAERLSSAEEVSNSWNRYFEAIIIRDRKKGVPSVLDPNGPCQTLGLPLQSAVYETENGFIIEESSERLGIRMAEDDRKGSIDIYVAPAFQLADINRLGLGRNR